MNMAQTSKKAEGWGAAFRLARREARAGLAGFRVFVLALALGVAAIAAIGSVSEAFLQGLQNEQRRLLGADVEVTAINDVLPDDALTMLRARGRVSEIVDIQTMAHRADGRAHAVIEFKGVDAAYPLIGSVKISGADATLSQALAPRASDGKTLWGALADEALFQRFNLSVGDRIDIGGAVFEMRGVLASEPDRATAGFMLGPRVLTSMAGAAATGLLGEGGIVNRGYRVALAGGTAKGLVDDLRAAYPEKAWRIRTASQAARGLERLLENLDVFLTMIGLSTLVIGGVGAANAVRAYMDRKTPVIATLKCLGATGDLILKTYFLQILMVAAFAVVLGLVAGALAPFALARLAGALLPFDAAHGVFPAALARAAAYGILAAAAFALWPLARARMTPAARLFRNAIESDSARPAIRDMALVALAAGAFAGLAVLLAKDTMFALMFAGGGVIAYAALRLAAWALVRIARKVARPRRPALRIALANLTRPGAATAGVTVSLGLGLTLLAAVSLIDDNLNRQVTEAFPERAPSLFFADIPFDGTARFDADIAEAAKGGDYERYYMLRSGVVKLNGAPVREVESARRSPWVRDNDWAVTILPEIPKALGEIVEGDPWPPGYSGPPLISLSDRQAETFGLKVGDTMTLSISGREVKATIANLRKVDWDRGGLNFVAVFAPGTLEAARPTSVGSLRAPQLSTETAVVDRIASDFPNVTVIRTREAVAAVAAVLDEIGVAIRILTGFAIAAGIVVLLGAIAADYRRKLYDAMVMKTIGASRARILAAHAIEYAVLGAAPALLAAGLGWIGGWFVVAKRMELSWRLSPEILIGVIGGAAGVTLLIGIAAAWRILDARPWPVLRSE